MNRSYGPGRVQTTGAKPSHFAPGAVPFTAGRMCVLIGGGIARYVSGYPMSKDGQLCGSMTATMPIRNHHRGLPLTVNGRLAVDPNGAIHHHVRGIPLTVNGRICVAPDGVQDGVNEEADDAVPPTQP